MTHKILDWRPWTPTSFWSSARVLRLSESACNLYRWMLDHQWIHGSVPDDPLLVRRMYPWGESVEASWPSVRALFTVTEAGLVCPETAALHAEQVERLSSGRLQRAEAGRRSAAARAQKYGSSAPAVNGRSNDSSTVVRTEPVNGRTTDRNGSERIGSELNGSETRKRAPRERPPAADPWLEAIDSLVPPKDRADWAEVCASHAAHRRRWKHPKLQADTWRERVKTWLPRGLAAFRQAVADSGEHGWQGLFPPKAGTAPTGTIQKGPNRGQPSAREMLLGTPPPPVQPTTQPVRETTARVVNP